MLVKHFVSVLGLLLLACGAQAQILDPAKIKSRDVAYISHKKLKVFPTPTLMYFNDEPQHEKLKGEVAERIVYPMLCESAKPVAVVAVDFCPEIYGSDERGCTNEDRGKLTIKVAIRWHDGSYFESMIDANLNGNFDDGAYLTLFPGGYQGYVPRNKGCKARKVER